jgi:hypothetical protein
LNADADEWSTFRHPSGVFTIKIPTTWGKGVRFSDDPGVYTFKPSLSAELRVTTNRIVNLPPELPMDFVRWMFPKETPISTPKREKGDGWNSIRQDFRGTLGGKKWVWLARFYGFEKNVVVITLSDRKENIKRHRPVFEEITNSVSFIRQKN